MATKRVPAMDEFPFQQTVIGPITEGELASPPIYKSDRYLVVSGANDGNIAYAIDGATGGEYEWAYLTPAPGWLVYQQFDSKYYKNVSATVWEETLLIGPTGPQGDVGPTGNNGETGPIGIPGSSYWVKYTVTYDQFTGFTGTDETIEVGTFPANTQVVGSVIDVTVGFTGTDMPSLTLEPKAEGHPFISAEVVGITRYSTGNPDYASVSSTPLLVRLYNAETGTFDTLTAGSVDIWLQLSSISLDGGPGNDLQISGAGTFQYPYPFEVIQYAPAPVTALSGTPATLNTGGLGIKNFDYGESANEPHVTSLSFANLKYVDVLSPAFLPGLTGISCPVLEACKTFAINNCASLTTMDFPELTGIDMFYPQALAGITMMAFPALTRVGSVFSPSNLNTLITMSFPSLTTISGAINPSDMNSLTNMEFPELTSVGGGLGIGSMSGLTMVSFPSLTTISGAFIMSDCDSLATMDFPNLNTIGDFTPSSLAGLTMMSFPTLTTVISSFSPSTMSNLTTMDFPNLTTVGTLGPNSIDGLTMMSFPALTTVTGSFSPGSMASLTTMDFPELTSVGGLYPSSLGLTMMSFPALTTVATSFQQSYMANLTTIAFPALVTSGSIDSYYGLGALADVTIGATGTTKVIDGDINLSGQALTQASVDYMLAVVASLDGTNGTTEWGTGRTLSLNGGTSSPPSAAGLVNKGIIEARGGTVNVNS